MGALSTTICDDDVAIARRPPRVALAPPPAGRTHRFAPSGEVTPLLPPVPTALQRRRDDAWLAARVGRVLPDPFDVLFERHWAHLRTYCLGILGSADEAQDAAQEAMLRTYRRLWRADEIPPVKPLLFAIARNTCIDRLRERGRDAGPVEEHHLPVAAGADDDATRRNGVGLLVADLRALSERQRNALVLRTACDLSYHEIAVTLDTTPARVKSLISEARQALEQRRAGHELSCEEYQREVARTRGPVRNQGLLAHRSTCTRCDEHASPLFGLGLPALAAGWLLRRARDVVHAVRAPVASPSVAKLAIGVACLGTAATPGVRALDGAPGASQAANAVRAAASVSATPQRREVRATAYSTASPADARRTVAAARPAPSERSGAASRHGEDRAAGGTTATAATTAPRPDMVRTTLTRVQETVRDVPRRLAATTPVVRDVTTDTVREVVRVARPTADPAPATVDAVPDRAAPRASEVRRLLGR